MLSTALSAKHIIGGDLTYECLGIENGKVSYRVTLIMYRDATDPNAADADRNIEIGVYSETPTGWTYVRTESVALGNEVRIIPESPSPCLTIPNLRIFRAEYQFDIDLDIISSSYMLAYQRCCRNTTINNINNPGDQGAAFTVVITPEGQMGCNNSPAFNGFPPIVICANRNLSFDHGATDADGDQLEFSFCAPLTAGGQGGTRQGDPPGAARRCDGVTPDPAVCPPPFAEVQYKVPLFTENTPLAGNPVVQIDQFTGLITGRPELLGQFVVGVCVKEFRNGVLIGEIRRDFQFNVETCTVNVEASIEAELIGPKQYQIDLCGVDTVTIQNTSQDERKIFEYDWLFNSSAGSIESTVRSPRLEFPDLGTYDGILVLNKQDSICSDTVAITVNVFPSIEADYSIDYDTCIRGPVSFFDESVANAVGGVQQWEWDFADGDVSDQRNPIHSYSEPAEYNAQLVITDANNCKDSINKTFVWAPVPPLIVVEPNVFVGCSSDGLEFSNLSEPVNELYDITWNFGDGTSSKEISPTHKYEGPGLYTIDLTIVSPFGCSISKRYADWIEILKKPEAAFTYTPEMPNIFEKTVDFQDQSVEAKHWTWTFGDLDYSADQNPTYTFPDTGFFDVQLIVQHESGCTDTALQRVEVIPLSTLFFPNAFTPNNDGLNESFMGVGFLSGIRQYELAVWNRWGEEIFSSDDPLQGWNGRRQNTGDLLQEGVYVYTVKYTDPRGNKKSDKGTVTLIR